MRPLVRDVGDGVRRISVVPLEGVEVSSGPERVITDASGNYIPGLTATSSIVVTKYPYKQERRSLYLTGDTRLDLHLVRRERHAVHQ